jgi:hypothetical protein
MARVAGGLESSHDDELGENPVVPNELVEYRQGLDADTTLPPSRANTHSEARHAHQSRLRLGYRHIDHAEETRTIVAGLFRTWDFTARY